MVLIAAKVTRFVSDEPQPGIVECMFTDAFGRPHFFLEKTAIVSNEALLATTAYPIACELAGEIVVEWEEASGPLVRVSTEWPWHIASVDGKTSFVLRPAQLRRSF